MRHSLTSLYAAIFLAAASCSGGQTGVPRPEAFPRIEMPDSTYTFLDIDGTEIAVNEGSETEISTKENGDRWLTIAYPAHTHANVYLTLSHAPAPGSEESIAENRRERMALNLAGTEGIATTLTSRNGWQCEMLTSRGALSTPVQILATKPGMVISGTLYLQVEPDASADSLAPVIEAIDRDMLTLLKNL